MESWRSPARTAPVSANNAAQYPFDIDQALLWFADLADLVLVFLDPIGQSLCKRTMDIVRALQARHGHKIRYYLTKADQVQRALSAVWTGNGRGGGGTGTSF